MKKDTVTVFTVCVCMCVEITEHKDRELGMS